MIAARIKWAALAGVANTMLALVYATVMPDLYALVEAHPGPFTPTVEMIETLVPPLIGLLYLVIAIVILAGPFQYERSRTQIRRRLR
jgi:uncharacterized membrane protein